MMNTRKTKALLKAYLQYVCCSLFALSVSGATYTLNDAGTGDFPTIADALADANVINGDVIELEPGLYTLTANLAIDKAVTIQGTTGNPADAVIDGDGQYVIQMNAADAAVRGVTFQRGASGYGIQMTGARTMLDNCIVKNCTSGGVHINASEAVATNCVITANTGGNGAGVAMSSGLLVDSIVEGNTGTGNSGGGGIWTSNPNAVVDRCVITNNTAPNGGGGIWTRGGGTIRNSFIARNKTTQSGSSSWLGGGGLFHDSHGSLVVENCTIVGNTSAATGGGLGLGADATVRNVIVADNTSAGGTTEQDVFRDSTATRRIEYSYVGTGLDSYSNTSGILTQATDGPPLFADDTNGDYRLTRQSPCRGTGTLQPWMDTALDLDHNPRTYGDLTQLVDMGCYAYLPQPGEIFFFIAADTLFAQPGTTVEFTPSASGDTTGLQITWNFGDGSGLLTTYNLNPVQRLYDQPGVYTVTATATAAGGTDSDSLTLYIVPDAPVYVSPTGANIFPYTSPANAARAPGDALLALEYIWASYGTVQKLYVCPGTNTLTANLILARAHEVLGTDTREACVIDGAGQYVIQLRSADAAVRGVTFQRGANGYGIQMTGARTLLDNCIVRDCTSGGVHINASGAVATNCVITANTGRGMEINAGLLVDSIVDGNSVSGSSGGGVFTSSANAVIDRCVIMNNTAFHGGGGVWTRGGGIVRNSLLAKNKTTDSGSSWWLGGGGLHHDSGGSLVVENCTFVENTSAATGGGISLGADATIRNVIAVGNTGTGGAAEQDVFRDNTAMRRIEYSYVGTGLADYANASDILSFEDDTDNAVTAVGEPGFKDASAGNYRLNRKTSPCINAGLVLPDSWMQASLDLDRNPRLFKGMIDMGAFQNQEVLIHPTLIQIK